MATADEIYSEGAKAAEAAYRVFCHEMSSALFGAHGYCQMSLEKARLRGIDPEIMEYLELTNREMERVSRLVADYKKNSLSENMVVDVASVISDSVKLTRVRSSPIVLTAEIADHPLFVFASRDKLMQICMNILNNAVDAVSGSAEKRIDVSLSDEGDVICIEFSDSGGGIESAILPRIFDECFTTKINNGMGLGLYISRCMANSFGGEIEARNNEMGGATFSVRLPKSKEEPQYQ